MNQHALSAMKFGDWEFSKSFYEACGCFSNEHHFTYCIHMQKVFACIHIEFGYTYIYLPFLGLSISLLSYPSYSWNGILVQTVNIDVCVQNILIITISY